MYSLYCSALYNVHSTVARKGSWWRNLGGAIWIWHTDCGSSPLILSVSDAGQYVRVLLLICNGSQDLSTLVSCTFFVNWPPPWYLPHPALLLVKVWDIQIAVRDWNAAVQYIQVAMPRENIFPPDYQINKLASNWWMFHEGWRSQTCLSARFAVRDFSVESSGENGGITVWAKDDSSENHFFPASLISQTVCSLSMQTFQNLFCGEREMQFATYHHIAAIRLELMLVFMAREMMQFKWVDAMQMQDTGSRLAPGTVGRCRK